jgi:hypothetical protein
MFWHTSVLVFWVVECISICTYIFNHQHSYLISKLLNDGMIQSIKLHSLGSVLDFPLLIIENIQQKLWEYPWTSKTKTERECLTDFCKQIDRNDSVIENSSFYQTQLSIGALPPCHLRTATFKISKTLCFVCNMKKPTNSRPSHAE